MDNITIEFVSALETVLPTHYELALTKNTETPCISYQMRNSYVSTEVVGATLGYGAVIFTVKIWSNRAADLAEYMSLVDTAVRPLGYKRTSANELHDVNSTMMQRILTYEAMVYEEY